MNKVDLLKAGVGLIVGAGVSHVVGGAIKNLVPQQTLMQKALTFSGKTAITMIVSDAAQNAVSDRIDAIISWTQKNVSVSTEN